MMEIVIVLLTICLGVQYGVLLILFLGHQLHLIGVTSKWKFILYLIPFIPLWDFLWFAVKSINRASSSGWSAIGPEKNREITPAEGLSNSRL